LNSSQYETFVGNTIQQYNNNTNGTAMPTTFTIPQSDYINLGGVHVSPTNPFNRKLDDLLGAFKKQTGDENFQILPKSSQTRSRTRNAQTARATQIRGLARVGR
jgi:hypothetical protein